jgi:ElaB/YqjD/DUF883 family membrane-anchored ribosome-binding protein
MPQRDNELPEGTDHIINGAMETNGRSAGGAGEPAAGGGSSSGFVGASAGDDTGGAAAGGRSMTTTTRKTKTTGGGDDQPGGGQGGVVEQLRGQASTLRDQAGGRVREFAEGGKTRASDALTDLARVVADTADSIDERLGGDYGDYARRASDAVSGFADSLRNKDVDDIYDEVRSAVRKSPAVAIGVAAVVGFTLVRLVKAGFPDRDEGGEGGRGSGGTGA